MGNMNYIQPMGTAGKLIRIMIILLISIIAWKLWYYVFSVGPVAIPTDIKVSMEHRPNSIKGVPHQTEKLDAVAPEPLRVGVYYEALCPDSRDFIIRQLLPTYEAMQDIVTIDLVPYGKASSRVTSSGRKTFKCQHGPKECSANIVHACVSKHVQDEMTRLQVVKCMIEINHRVKEPLEAGHQCMSPYGDEKKWTEIETCSAGDEGEELLFHLGKMTDDLTPRASFIPTITINDSQRNQPLILRDLKTALCRAYKGPKHSSCSS